MAITYGKLQRELLLIFILLSLLTFLGGMTAAMIRAFEPSVVRQWIYCLTLIYALAYGWVLWLQILRYAIRRAL